MVNTNASNTDPSKKFTSTCNTYFENIPYPWQSAIGNRVINYFLIPTDPTNQLCVCPTGGGKNLLFTTIDSDLKGVTLCITPIISLGANQSEKLNSRAIAEAWLISFQMEDLDATTMVEVRYLLQTLHPQGTVVIFASPQ